MRWRQPLGASLEDYWETLDTGPVRPSSPRHRLNLRYSYCAGSPTIRRYLGQGNPDNSLRGERQIREAITTLKQSGRYDEMVDAAIRKHPQPVTDKPSANGKTVATTKVKRKPVLDERTANLFPKALLQAFRGRINRLRRRSSRLPTVDCMAIMTAIAPARNDWRAVHQEDCAAPLGGHERTARYR
jgi:hypothetical protein